MNVALNPAPIYTLHLRETSVELRLANDATASRDCLFSEEENYYVALDFGRDLAAYKRIPFNNYVASMRRDTFLCNAA